MMPASRRTAPATAITAGPDPSPSAASSETGVGFLSEGSLDGVLGTGTPGTVVTTEGSLCEAGGFESLGEVVTVGEGTADALPVPARP